MALYLGSSHKQKIDMLLHGNGVEYTDVVYNDDDTITLIDKKGIAHTIECLYESNKLEKKLIGISYDGIGTRLNYEGNTLIKMGKTDINMENAPSTDMTETGGARIVADASVSSVTLPIYIPTILVDTSNSIMVDASARLEE